MFDEKFFMYHEDLDLCWRVRLGGYKIMLATKSIVYHDYEFNRNKMMFYWAERNRLACLLQNYSISTLIKLFPMLFFVELMILVYSLFGGWIHLKLKSYVWIVRNIRSIFSQRKKTQSIRKVSDKEIFKRMDSKLEFAEVKNPIIKYIASPIIDLYYNFIKIFI
jgi:GT2 family glycosyltransferase